MGEHVETSIPVSSGWLTGIGYNAETKTLAVSFKGDVLYNYQGVELELFESMKAESDSGGSVGKFFHAHVKGKYAQTPVG